MQEGETIQEMHTRSTIIINKPHCLGEDIRPTKQVHRVLSILPNFRERKFNDITEAKDLKTMTKDQFIGNIKTYELKKQQDKARGEQKKGKTLMLKSIKQDSNGDDE